MRWQEQQMQSFWNHQISTLVPASLIQNQEQVLGWTHFVLLGESGESEGKSRGIDRRHEQPTGLSALWLDKSIEIYPLVAWSDQRSHSGSLSGPDPAQDWFETDAVFILAPEFNAGSWIRLTQCFNLLWEFF
jgi:hypothetical protein